VTLRVAFAGTPDFAAPVLRACASVCDLALVITKPDKPGNRGQVTSPAMAGVAKELGIEVFQPARIRDSSAVETILGYNIDALVVASYGQIIPVELLDGPRFGGVNVHPSLLPRWRGASPVASAVLAGDDVTGVCIMKMDAGMDTGPIYACRERTIGQHDTAPELLEALFADGAELLVEVLAGLEAGTAALTEQSESGVTIAPRLSREVGVVDWAEMDAARVDRMVRALNPWPGVTATVKGRPIRIHSGRIADAQADANPAVVATRDGAYELIEVQPPGKRVMPATDFLRGIRT
jgi:methionyl-tRNA formyltransferase